MHHHKIHGHLICVCICMFRNAFDRHAEYIYIFIRNIYSAQNITLNIRDGTFVNMKTRIHIDLRARSLPAHQSDIYPSSQHLHCAKRKQRTSVRARIRFKCCCYMLLLVLCALALRKDMTIYLHMNVMFSSTCLHDMRGKRLSISLSLYEKNHHAAQFARCVVRNFAN